MVVELILMTILKFNSPKDFSGWGLLIGLLAIMFFPFITPLLFKNHKTERGAGSLILIGAIILIIITCILSMF
jgi:hypothetical protein